MSGPSSGCVDCSRFSVAVAAVVMVCDDMGSDEM
jgi:hypothetical protein